jgi:hypothetical protein
VHLVLACLGVMLAIAGEVTLDGRSGWPVHIGIFGLALGLFLFGTQREQLLPERDSCPSLPMIHSKRIRWLLACLSLLLATITFATAGGNRFRWTTVVAWAGACGGWFLAFSERPRRGPGLPRWLGAHRLSLNLGWRHLVLLAILLLAAWFRFYRLQEVPGEMTIDHPPKLLDIRDLLQGQYRIFFPRNTGREPLQFYYTAALVRAFSLGLTHDTLRLGTALISLATVTMTYLLALEIFGIETALGAVAFLAISRWDLGISRMGLRFPFAALALAPALLLLHCALRTGRRNDALLCGLVLGLGLYGYSSFRVVPGLVALAVLLKWLLDREGVRQIGQRRFWGNAALILVLAALSFMPLARYMVDNPAMFWFRVLTRASDVEREPPASPAPVFLRNVANSLLAFNVQGDVGWVHQIPRSPFLDPISGALFFLGAGAAGWRLLRHRDWRSGCLLLGLLLLLLPSSLSLAFPRENPSSNRSGVAIPVVFTLVGLAPGLLLRVEWKTRNRGARAVAVVCLALLFGTAGRVNYRSYFGDYAAQFGVRAWNASELAQVIRGFADCCGSLDHAYIAPWPGFADGRAVAFELGAWEWYNLLGDLSGLEEQAARPGSKLYLAHFADIACLERLRETYPHAQVRRYLSSTAGRDFWIVFVPEA